MSGVLECHWLPCSVSEFYPVTLRKDLLCRLCFKGSGLSCSGRQQLVPLPLQKHRLPHLPSSGDQRLSSFLPDSGSAWVWWGAQQRSPETAVRAGWVVSRGSQGRWPPPLRHAGNATWDRARGVRDAGARSARVPLHTIRYVSSDHSILWRRGRWEALLGPGEGCAPGQQSNENMAAWHWWSHDDMFSVPRDIFLKEILILPAPISLACSCRAAELPSPQQE